MKQQILEAHDQDPTAESRKHDHIEKAFQSQIGQAQLDNRFYYEPMLAAHPMRGSLKSLLFLGKTFRAPLWVSSMTGGTAMAGIINQNLARACGEFGFGMGLGSCRALLFSDEHLKDFNVRPLMGHDVPLYANLGIAQLEQLIESGQLFRIKELVDKLQADGLIIHVNPMQEWLQPEGDRFKYSPLQTIETILERVDVPLIVKEVGQGFGMASMQKLLELPLKAIDFAAGGGTNFAKLELLRSDDLQQETYNTLANLGHSASEMVEMANQLFDKINSNCHQIIISGGVQNFLDGYYLIEKSKYPAIYGQASSFLRHAQGDYDSLAKYVDAQIRGLEVAKAFLTIK